MLSEPPRCRPFPVLALKGADSPRGLHRSHSPGHGSPPGARSTGGGWLLPASWPDPKSLRQVDPDHDERYRGDGAIRQVQSTMTVRSGGETGRLMLFTASPQGYSSLGSEPA